jgi:hypothetical protein
MPAVTTLIIVATGQPVGRRGVSVNDAASPGAVVKDSTFAPNSIAQPIGVPLTNAATTARSLAIARPVSSERANYPFVRGELMSASGIVLSMAVLLMASVRAVAQEAWLLVLRDKHYEVLHATKSSVKPIAVCGDYALYSDSLDQVAIVSRDTRARRGSFILIDKKTQTVSSQWPASAFPAMKLAGASRDLVLKGDYAYFPSVRYRADGSIEPNALGGSFDLVRKSIIDGIETSYPLPPEVLSPRAALGGGGILVSNGTQEQIWRLEEHAGRFDRLSHNDTGLTQNAGMPWTSEALRTRVRNSVGASEDGEKSYIDRIDVNGHAWLQLLRRKGASTQLYFLDPNSFKVSWGIEIDARPVKESLIPVNENAVAFFDAERASVLLTTSSGVTREIWNLSRLEPGITTVDSRIISMKPQ